MILQLTLQWMQTTFPIVGCADDSADVWVGAVVVGLDIADDADFDVDVDFVASRCLRRQRWSYEDFRSAGVRSALM